MNFFLNPAQESIYLWEWLSRAADSLGILSFLMTTALIFITRSIRQQFVSRIRLPELSKSLGKLSKEISGYDIGQSNPSEIQKRLGKTKAQLKEAKSLLAKSERDVFNETISEIEALMKSKLSNPTEADKEKYWEMYGNLIICIEVISQYCNIARQA